MEIMMMGDMNYSWTAPMTPPPADWQPCRVYWGSHGCMLERDHEGDPLTSHVCSCCECESHPDDDSGCVGRYPYYNSDGVTTNFYGKDAERLGLSNDWTPEPDDEEDD